MRKIARLGLHGVLPLILLAQLGCGNEPEAERPVGPTEAGVIAADPNPIQVCDGSDRGATTLLWRATGPTRVELRIGSPAGRVFARKGPVGAKATKKWVRDGTVFYLQDASGGKPSATESTLATIEVIVTDVGCP